MMMLLKIMVQKFSIVLFLFVFSSVARAQQRLNITIETKVGALLKQMTLEEKVGQMAQISN